jgi:hypothetical protein
VKQGLNAILLIFSPNLSPSRQLAWRRSQGGRNHGFRKSLILTEIARKEICEKYLKAIPEFTTTTKNNCAKSDNGKVLTSKE